MSPPTLRQLCTATAIRNVKYLNDIGNIPYVLARPFLLKIESPEKLRSLELQSPHLMKDDVELWLEFIKRDIPKWEEYQLPEQPDCWYDVYCELREEVQRAVDEDAEKLKMALDGISSERAKHSTKFVTDRRTVRLPRDRPTAKQRYATYDRKMGGIAPVFSSKSGGSSSDPMSSPVWSFERPSMPRSQAPKKNNIFTASKRNSVLAVPTKQLNNRATRVSQAPRSLIEDHRRPPEPSVARLRAPGRSSLQNASNTRSQASPLLSSSLREREARLRTITTGRTSTSAQSRSPVQASSLGRPRASSSALPPSSESQPQTASSARLENHRPSKTSARTDPDEPIPPPPRPTIRKRPAPNPFIRPKKRR
ncbi:RNA polymerase II transcription factor SIII subunit A-domain-containing protein [Aspergillus aurantiobrunneus]